MKEEPKIEKEMRTLVDCLNGLLEQGFTENYKVTGEGLKSLESGAIYPPEKVRILNFYRFEGSSDPGDESILYAIETSDGKKGTMVDAYGPMSDTKVTAFMSQVEGMHKLT